MVKYLVKNCKKNWIIVKHRLTEKFCLVNILKFSLFRDFESVHSVVRYSADNGG